MGSQSDQIKYLYGLDDFRQQFAMHHPSCTTHIGIDASYAENDFIQKFGRFLDVDRLFAPHVYSIMLGDAGFYQITFENGRPVLFQCFYYC